MTMDRFLRGLGATVLVAGVLGLYAFSMAQAQFSLKSCFKVVEALVCFIAAFFFSAIGLFHLRSLERRMDSSTVARHWLVGFGSGILAFILVWAACWSIITL